MPSLPTGRSPLRRLQATFALALGFLSLAGSNASAQYGRHKGGTAESFYGPGYRAQGYGDSVGIRGHKKLENGGYFGPPQIYSRQYGRLNNFPTARPFVLPPTYGGTGYGGDDFPYPR